MLDSYFPDSQSSLHKNVFIKDLKAKDIVRSSFLVKNKELLSSKNGKPYLALTLKDNSGEMDSRVWDGVEKLSAQFNEGDVVVISGKVNAFQNRLQLVVEHLIPLAENEVDLAQYLPKAEANVDELYQQLVDKFETLKNPWIKELSLSLLKDPEIAGRYKQCPAAKTIHHAFIGGLLSHSLQLVNLAEAVLPYYNDIDRDLVFFGAAFHDFGKIFELSYEKLFGYTDEGQLVGHMTIAICLIDRKIQTMPGFPKDLEYHVKHLILSHHGKLEYGSPKKPATLEAQLVHHLDDMDSKLNSIHTLLRAEKNGQRWTGYHRAYDQYYYKPAHLIGEAQS